MDGLYGPRSGPAPLSNALYAGLQAAAAQGVIPNAPTDLRLFAQSIFPGFGFDGAPELPNLRPQGEDTGSNNLVVFRGRFNPPHAGHAHALAAVLEPRINEMVRFIGAIIVITESPEDERAPGNFPVAERARIWREIISNLDLFRERVIVLPDSLNIHETHIWNRVALITHEIADTRGYRLHFAGLFGADCVHGDYPPPLEEWGPPGCTNCLVLTDMSVDADFREYADRYRVRVSHPDPRAGFSCWTPIGRLPREDPYCVEVVGLIRAWDLLKGTEIMFIARNNNEPLERRYSSAGIRGVVANTHVSQWAEDLGGLWMLSPSRRWTIYRRISPVPVPEPPASQEQTVQSSGEV
ncbi:hypothetical protein QBC44DRAFT_374225 [Cladorrhinum sp. PSN332]|nr:hypothetical protein QBC44DRAFT_374225 [Cladorrhinum sp. PSN332]